MKNIDQSPSLIKFITNLSRELAKQRGLPIVVGIICVVIGGTFEFLNIFFDNSILAMIEVALRNFGLVTALIGIALLEPLG